MTKDEVVPIEKETAKQTTCTKWKYLREKRITSTNTHKIFLQKKKKIESLYENGLNKTEKKILTFVQDALKHGHRYEPVASRKYEIMQYKMKRNIFLRETGLNIQSLLFWLDVSPEGLIYDKEYSDDPGLLEIKCPSNRRNSSPADLLSYHSFYLQQNKHGEFCLKKIIILIIIPKFK